MKTIEELKKQEPLYLCDFSNKEDVSNQFEDKLILEKNILFAVYVYEWYTGNAFVLFEENDKLYSVYGSHCSCYGLENQWCPEETDLEHLHHLILNGYYFDDMEKEQICIFLGIDFNNLKTKEN